MYSAPLFLSRWSFKRGCDCSRCGWCSSDEDSSFLEGSRAEAEVHFEKSVLVQPPLAETIKLAAGVVLTEGSSVLEGPMPDRKISGKMSRGDFMVGSDDCAGGGFVWRVRCWLL